MTLAELMCTVIAAGGQAGGGGNGGDGGGGGSLFTQLGGLIPVLLIVIVFFWLMNRSQKKKEQQREEMLDSIQVKDDVVTIGGIHGRVVTMEDDALQLRVDKEKDVKIWVSRNGISGKRGEQEEEE